MFMRKVLIPTDFSPASRNAYYYALELYGNTDTTFDVVHTHHAAFDPSQPTVLDFTLGIDQVKQENLEHFIDLIPDAIKKNLPEDIKIKGEVIIGFASELIVDLSKDYDVIIMGMTGSNQLVDKIFGSISLEVARKAVCPVFLVPETAKYTVPKNIVYACDLDGVEPKVLEKIIAFAARFDGQVHFLHVITDQNKNFDVGEAIKGNNFPVTYYTQTIMAETVSDGINAYVEKHHVNLLIMARKKRSFWDQVLHKSITKKMAINTKIPLLVYHE
jgi:nucleotide-binding universal stress UspA family protein